jgi:hypothetical protein
VTVTLVAAIAAGVWAVATPGRAQLSRPPLVLEPLGVKGEAIFPAFEGWGPDKTGENLLILLGYYNRNKSQELVIPVGPDNRIEPEGPDYGQPTYFYTGRQHGVFAIKVPKDFGNKRLTWADFHRVVLAQPALLDRFLPSSRQRQSTAHRPNRAQWADHVRPSCRHRANTVGDCGEADSAVAMGLRSAHAEGGC